MAPTRTAGATYGQVHPGASADAAQSPSSYTGVNNAFQAQDLSPIFIDTFIRDFEEVEYVITPAEDSNLGPDQIYCLAVSSTTSNFRIPAYLPGELKSSAGT